MRLPPSLSWLPMLLAACSDAPAPRPTELPTTDPRPSAAEGEASPAASDAMSRQRAEMVETQLVGRDIVSPSVLAAMGRVPRHRFVPASLRSHAYADRPLPIGFDQTISQPYIVALMSQLADVEPGERVLEIGTGSAYQAAVLAEMGVEVFSIEIVEPLGHRARWTLNEAGYERVQTQIGDGYVGWPEEAPFDAVLLTAAPPEIPQPLLDQIAVGGRLVAPVGRGLQELVVIRREQDGLHREPGIAVRFVPMTGQAQQAQ